MEEIDRILNLIQSEDPQQRNIALDSLPATYSERITLALINLLRDDNLSLRQRSMSALIQQGPFSVEPLIEALRINDYDIQFNVIRILGAIGDRRATTHLMEIGEHAPESLHYEITEALVHVQDPQTIPALITALSHKEVGIRNLAAKGLTELGTAALPALCVALQSSQWLTRSYAARILGDIQDEGALEPLIVVLNHSDSLFRIEAIKALGKLENRAAVPALLKALAQNEQETTKPLVETLGQLKDLRAVQPMIEAFKVEEWSQHEYIVDSVVSMGPQVINELRVFTNDNSPRIRIGVVKILSRLNHPDVLPPLIQLSQDADQEIREITAVALGQHQDESSVRSLIDMLGDQNNDVSSEAAQSIIRLAPNSRTTLIHGLCHNAPTIRRRAATLLCRKDLHAGATSPLEIPAYTTPYLMDSLRHERQYIKYLSFLLRHIKGDSLAPRIGLIYQGHSQMALLIEELRQKEQWQHLSLLAQDLDILTAKLEKREAKAVAQALREAAKDQRKIAKSGYCLQHYARFNEFKASGIEYVGCRVCQSTIFGVTAPVVYLLLDNTIEKEKDVFPDRVLINRLKVSQLVDFDHIHIGPCDGEDIRSLCIEIGNDTDSFRQKAYARAHCSISTTAKVSEEIFNLLRHHFKSVHLVQ